MRKSHPIRRAVLAGAATVSGIVLLLSLKPASDPASASAAGAAPQQTAAAQEAPQGGSGAQRTGTQSVTGDVARTEYGDVQVRLTVSDGRITAAEAVRAPQGGVSGQKSELAVPKLNQEAVAAQNANIDTVSGATYTSGGYKKSLQSALDRMTASGAPSGSSSGAPSGSSSGAPSGSSSGAPSGSSSSGAAGSGAAQARTVTGETAQTDYGPVQVRITVTDGRITKAEAVQAPQGGLSGQKSELAVPKLNQEAVAAQNANIDTVSGATYTSGGYKKSLQSALDKAGG
ncbi:FMN-binding protein [Streptomyces sp. NPDC088337]|uniref:FMN-binding protein n=1 Tax=unclassified Streptomyces TaxID=2593676 RepID=UPI002DD8298E|nr:FMN-binding protein [Streptomyces sp. NBC_01788]WSB25850.1 FMN-binding protein [Streptomyces sp. NBC_01788]